MNRLDFPGTLVRVRRALVSMVVVLGLLAAGCGSSSSSTTSTTATPAGSAGGAGSAAPKFAFAGPAIPSSMGVIVSLSCQGATGTTCPGREQLTTAEKLVVAEATFALATGSTHLIGAPLNATGKRLLKRFGKLPVTMTITLLNTNPPTAIKTNATIK